MLTTMLQARPAAALRALGAAPPPADVAGPYRVCRAGSEAEVRAAQRLRFQVFSLEQGAGLARSYGSGLDEDPLDAVCDHLLVVDELSGRVVATCRLQSGWRALAALGWCGERLFDLAPFEPRRGHIVEASRACVAAVHRSRDVADLLWRGIAAYAVRNGARELLAASAIGSRDERVGAATWKRLQGHLVHDELVTLPHPHAACALGHAAARPQVPALLDVLLGRGARVCAPPAIDGDGGMIELLTWMDLALAGVSGWCRHS